MGKIYSIRRFIFSSLLALMVIFFGNMFVLHASAADARVRFGSNYYEKNQGDRFPMGVYVENADGSAAGIGSYHIEISFDSSLIQYSEGASAIQGNGVIVLDGTGDGNQNKTMIYFNALYGGSTNVTVTSAVVYTTDGTVMDVTYLGSVPVTVNGTPPASATDDEEDDETTQNEDNDSALDDAEEDADGTGGEEIETIDAETTDSEQSDDADNIASSAEDDNVKVSEEAAPIETATETEEADILEEQTQNATVIDKGNSYLRYAIIGIAAVVLIIIVVVIVRTLIRVGVHRKKLEKMMDNRTDNQEWAFEFDTIDEDKVQNEDWEYDSSALEEDWLEDNDNSIDDYEGHDTDASGHGTVENDLDEEDFLFEINTTPKKGN